LLLEKGANIEVLMALGSKPVCEGRLQTAIVSDNENVVHLLLVMGADVEERGGAKKTPLLYAAWRSRVTVVKILVEAGADMKARDNTGWTLIHWAASRNDGDAEVLKFPLDNGGLEFFDVSTDPGNTPLHIAAMRDDRLAAAKMLVERGARVNLKNKYGETPYQVAAKGRPRSCETFVAATWARRTGAGNTP
jgi:hypothetical protein